MNLRERLQEDIKQKEKSTSFDPENALDQETMDYITRERNGTFINRQSSAFASAMSKGINTEESVFDRTAVFRTKQ